MTLPQRNGIRLCDFDYSSAGYYFITICTNGMRNSFGVIENGSMVLNGCGQLASRFATEIPKHIDQVQVDIHVVMPNHLHLILVVLPTPEKTQETGKTMVERSKQIIPRAIQQYKAAVSRSSKIRDLWHYRYYDHVIRDETEYGKIWEYIENNPLKWELDSYYE